MKTQKFKSIIVCCFVLVPLLSSIISTVHLVDLFYLGNPSWISYTIAIAVEVGAVASFLTLSILSKLNKTIVWSMFSILFFMQVVGNVYFSYDWVSEKIAKDPSWLSNFREMMEFFIYKVDMKTSKMILSLLIGIPIPLISVFLLKSTTDYLGTDEDTALTPILHKNVEDTEKNVQFTESTIEEKKEVEPEIHIIEDFSEDEETTRKRKRRHPART